MHNPGIGRPEIGRVIVDLSGSLWKSQQRVKFGPLNGAADKGAVLTDSRDYFVYRVPVGLGGRFFPSLFLSKDKIDSDGQIDIKAFAEIDQITLPKELESADFNSRNMSGATIAEFNDRLYPIFYWSPLSSSRSRILVVSMESKQNGTLMCDFAGRFLINS